MVKSYRPQTLSDALDKISKNNYKIIAGGTDLMVQKRRDFAIKPIFKLPLLFIEHLKELKQIHIKDNEIHIGACAILTDIINDNSIPNIFKNIINQMASPPTRNMATIGGNICNASPAGDTLPYLYAVDAKVKLQSIDNMQIISIQDFICGLKTTLLQKNEILTEIIIPNKTYNINYYKKLGQRKAMSLSKVSFLGMADISNNKVSDIRITLGSVAPIAVRSNKIEKLIIGKSFTDIQNIIPEILKQYDKLIKPIDDTRSTADYRKKVSLRLIEDFIESLG